MSDTSALTNPTDFDAKMLIGGKLVGASDGSVYENLDPFTEQVLGTAPDATHEDTDAAIAAAHHAFEESDWKNDRAFRARCLRQLQAAARGSSEELRRILVAEAGVPVKMTRTLQLDNTIDEIEYWAGLAENYDYEQWVTAEGRDDRFIFRDPVGVVSAITAYNYPFLQLMLKLGPSLAAGNAVVVKPSPYTPWTANLFARLVAEQTDIPAGILNVLTSSKASVGQLMVADPRVDMVTFTGSTEVGRAIGASAAQTAKNLVLELGGKSANIALDDADIAAVVRTNIQRMTRHSGQGCSNLTRLLLPRSRYEEGLEVAASAVKDVAWGDPKDPATHMGPLISDAQRTKVLGFIERSLDEGGRLVAGGKRPSSDTGFFVEPTVIADVEPSSFCAQEEAFGPVLAVMPYDDDREAVDIANNSYYGLAGAVSSASPERAMAVARQIKAAFVDCNGATYYNVDTPRGGLRQSGVGDEYGVAGFEAYTETRVISMPSGTHPHN